MISLKRSINTYILVIVILGIFALVFLPLRQPATTRRFFADNSFLLNEGLYPIEYDGTAKPFRWMNGNSSIVIPIEAGNNTLTLQTIADTKQLSVFSGMIKIGNIHSIQLSPQPEPQRTYHIFFADSMLNKQNLNLRLVSTTFSTPERQIGLGIRGIILTNLPKTIILRSIYVSLLICSVIILFFLQRSISSRWIKVVIIILLELFLLIISYRLSSTKPWLLVGYLTGFIFISAVTIFVKSFRYKTRSIRAAALQHWSILLFFVILGIIALIPVLPAYASRIIGPPLDSVQYSYTTGYVAKALTEGLNPFVDSQLNFPDTLYLGANDSPYLYMALVAPIARIFTPVAAYNTIILLNYIFSGFFCYLWLYTLTKSRFAGLIAGAAFAWSPYHLARAHGHLNLVVTLGIPLFFWALETTVAKPKPRLKDLLLVSGGMFLVGCASQYYTVICGLMGVAYVMFRSWNWRYIVMQGWKYVPFVAVSAVITSTPSLLTLQQDKSFEPYDIASTRDFSAALIDFFVPSRFNPFWGVQLDRASPRWLWIEFSLYLGAVALVLALLGWWLSRKRSVYTTTRAWILTALLAMLFALGTDLHLVPHKPVWGDQTFWLPMQFIGQLPGLDLMRVWARFGIITVLFVSLLAGVGAALLRERLRAGRWLPIGLLLLLLVDLAPYARMTSPLRLSPIDYWLQSQPGEFGAVVLPVTFENYQRNYGSLFHNKHLVAYLHLHHAPQAFREMGFKMASFPGPAATELALRSQLRYILLHKASYDGKRDPTFETIQAELSQNPHFRTVSEVDGYLILEVIP